MRFGMGAAGRDEPGGETYRMERCPGWEEERVFESGRISRRMFVALVGGVLSDGLVKNDVLGEDPWGALRLPDIWGFGQLLAFSGVDGSTDYGAGLVARSLEDPVGIEIMFPERVTLSFGARRVGGAEITSDSFQVITEKGRTRGGFIDAFHLLCEGPVDVGRLPAKLQAASEGPQTLIGSRAHFDAKMLRTDLTQVMDRRQGWLRRQVGPRGLTGDRRRTLSKALCVMKGQVCSAEGLLRHRWTTPDRWPHRDLWLWDTAFHAIGWRHVDPLLAREMIEAVLDAQQADGRLPHQANPARVSSITQPPVMALACQMVAGGAADLGWIEKVYPSLCRYIEWDLEHRIAPGEGLAQWLTDANPLSRCAESGMDNSPRFDGAALLHVVDLNAFLSMECQILSVFAKALGRTADAERWAGRNLELNRLIHERLWDDEAGFYFDEDAVQRRRTGVWAVSGFLPLLCGAATGPQVERLAAHLDNPKTFATAVPLASAVLTADTSRPQDMWRGPMWMNTNWLVALGFERAGRKDVALRLRERSLREVERWYLKRGSIFEFYDELGVTAPDQLPRKGPMEWGSAAHQAVHDYGWTATLYADLAYTTPPV
jgi:putative isomerase